MPFERYLDAASHALDDPGHGVDGAGLDASMFSANVQFQVPSLILGQPTLAPDGGAEVLPPAFLAHSSPYPHAPCPDSAFASHPGHTAYFHPAYAPALAYPSYTHHRPPPAYTPGLYAYSATGFDILDILSRVKNRPNPVVPLGPVDLTCAFTIADVRRPDAPIVYASPAFCALTGYAEHEILHRNCRFLQAPDARVAPGEPRRHPSAPAVAYMRSALAAGKECQATVINYRKGGAAFVNLVTVIPLLGGVHGSPDEADTVAFHVGFQVDLGAQPAAILAKLHDGTYATDLSRPAYSAPPTAIAPRNWRAAATAMRGVSDTLHALLEDPKFRCSLPPALDAVYVPPSAAAAPAATPSPPAEGDGNHSLHLALLAAAPDFVHVLSLKGAFLYVAPAVTHVLGYAPADLVGRSLADLCHPADVVPLMRELKESSVTPGPGSMHAHLYAEQGGGGGGGGTGPRKVDLLFRMPTKAGKLVWLECRGRLHVEPGKGRKAIILSGRVRAMPRLAWGAVARAGGLSPPVPVPRDASGAESDGEECETECWALLSARGTLLFAAAAVRDVAGWGAGEVIGRPVRELLGPADAVEGELARVCAPEGSSAGEARSVQCHLRTKDGARVPVRVVLYRAQDDVAADADASPVVCQIRMSDVDTGSAARLVHAPSESVFAELAAARASSWQYELQQLKYANQRLAEDVAALEQRLQQSRVQIPEHLQLPPLEHARHHQLHLPPLPVHSQHPPQMQLQLPPLATPAMPQYAQQYPPPRLALQLPPPPYPNAAVLPELSYSAPPREQDWRHDASQALLDLWQDPVQSHDPAGVPRYGLKRSWDDAEGGT